jgi:hypothetical protein
VTKPKHNYGESCPACIAAGVGSCCLAFPGWPVVAPAPQLVGVDPASPGGDFSSRVRLSPLGSEPWDFAAGEAS